MEVAALESPGSRAPNSPRRDSAGPLRSPRWERVRVRERERVRGRDASDWARRRRADARTRAPSARGSARADCPVRAARTTASSLSRDSECAPAGLMRCGRREVKEVRSDRSVLVLLQV